MSLAERSEISREVNGYKLGRILGKGAYGSVFVAAKAGEHYAVKVSLARAVVAVMVMEGWTC